MLRIDAGGIDKIYLLLCSPKGEVYLLARGCYAGFKQEVRGKIFIFPQEEARG
jgi:hypothetical protein